MLITQLCGGMGIEKKTINKCAAITHKRILNIHMEICIANVHTSHSHVHIGRDGKMTSHWEMWNDKVQNEVVKHLNEIVGHEIKSNQIRVIPMKKVILISNVPTAEYSISSPWTNNEKRIHHNYDANSWTEVGKISSTISESLYTILRYFRSSRKFKR